MAREDFSKIKQEVIDLIAELRVAKQAAEQFANELGKEIKVSNPQSTKQLNDLIKKIQEAEEALNAKTEAEKEEGEQQKKLRKVKEQLLNSQTEENKELIRYREELREANKQIKAQVVIEKELGIQYKNSADLIKKLNTEQIKQVSTIEEAQKQNKALRAVVKQLNADIPEQAESISRLNDVINTNTDFISDNSDEFIQNKINIGNYGESVVNAIESSNLFGEASGEISQGLNLVQGALGRVSERFEGYIERQEKAGKGTKRLRTGLKALGVVGAVVGIAVASVGAAFGTSQEKALELEIFIGRLKNTFFTLINVAGQIGNGIIESFDLISGKVSNTIDEIRIASLEARKSVADFFRQTDTSNQLQANIDSIRNNLVDLEDFNPGEIFTSAFDDFANRVEFANDQLETQLRLQFALENQARNSEVALANLGREQERLTRLAEDDTASLKEQIAFSRQAEEVARRRTGAEVSLAIERQRIAEQAIKVELARANLDTRLSSSILTNAAARDKVNKDSLDALKEANIAVIEAQTQQDEVLFSIQQTRRQAERDLFEQNLDFQIDVTERNRNLLIQQFEDTQKSVDGRLDAFGRLRTQLEEDLKAQGDLFDGLEDGLDIEVSVNGDDLSIAANGTELALNNTIELNKQLQDLGLNEIEINRLKEVITDGKDATKEIASLNKEFLRLQEITSKESEDALLLSEDELERTKELNTQLDNLVKRSSELSAEEFNKELDTILDAQNDLNDEISQRRIEDRIELIDKELELVEQGSIDEIELNKEKNELLTDLEEAKLKDAEKLAKEELKLKQEKAKEEEEIEKAKEKALDRLRDKAFDALIARQNRLSEERQEDLEEQIDASKQTIDSREAAAAEGNTIAAKAAADERQNQRQLTEDIRREKAKQLRDEIILTGLKSFAAKAGQPNAGVETVAELVGLLALLTASVPGFKDGGYTGDGGTNKVAGVTHGKEFVIDAEGTEALGLKGATMKDFNERFINNKIDPSSLISSFNEGELISPNGMFKSKFIHLQTQVDNAPLLKEIKNEIASIDVGDRALTVNQVKSIVEEIIDKNGSKEIRITRLS